MEPDERPEGVPSPRIAVYRRSLAAKFYRASALLGVSALASLAACGALENGSVWPLRLARFAFFSSLMISPLLALLGTLFGRLSSPRTGEVRCAQGAITLATASSQWKLASTETSSALLVLRESMWRVELVTARGDRVEISVDSEREGEAVLDSLGFLRGQRRMDVKSASLASKLKLGAMGFGFAMATIGLTVAQLGLFSPKAAYITGAIAAFVGVGSALLLLSRRSVSLGADGVTLEWGGSHFIAFREITSVDYEGDDLWIATLSGHRKSLKAWIDDPAVRVAVGRRIERAVESVSDRREPRLGLLDPQGRSLDAWRASLAELSAPGGYRGTALQPTELAAALESPAATMEQRLGAAIALAATSDDDGRTRIRVVADGCASPPVREAFVRIADGALEQSHLDEAMYELERANRNRG